MAETASARADIRDRVSSSYNFQEEAPSVSVRSQDQDRSLDFRQHMIAGSAAGIAEHVAMFPVDTVKTRVQMVSRPLVNSVNSVNPAGSFLSLIKHEGPLRLYRGVGAMVLGAGPSHAVYFAVYEECKRRFEGESSGFHPVAHMSAGAFATVAGDAVSTPMDVVKQRLQLKNSPYLGIGDCVRRIAREEGLRAFYASYRTTLVMNVPFTGVHFAVYEAAKKALAELSGGVTSEEHLVTHLVAGGTAGALASGVTTPLDVVKTRLQCQGVCGAERFHTGSMREVARKIIQHEGVGALFKGMTPRVLFHTPAAAISWSTYEAGKAFLERWSKQQHY